MFSPSLNGRFILFAGAVLMTSLLQVAPVSVSASAGMMALMWGTLGLFHLSATGWNLPDMLRGISSLPARLIRTVGAKEDQRASVIRTHLDRRGVSGVVRAGRVDAGVFARRRDSKKYSP
jgi:hypothetical protein